VRRLTRPERFRDECAAGVLESRDVLNCREQRSGR
jgi:hypothetical protein